MESLFRWWRWDRLQFLVVKKNATLRILVSVFWGTRALPFCWLHILGHGTQTLRLADPAELSEADVCTR